MENQYEETLKSKILPELEKGRPNWDKPHTETVVEYIILIINNSLYLKLDKPVLIIAAYAHDWGYAGLFNDGKPVQFEQVCDAKKAHMEIGADKLKNLLEDKNFDFLTPAQKDRAIYLVENHDNLSYIKDADEVVLMEADTLAGLDTDKVKPTFDKESNEKYLQAVKETRLPLFKTDYGKKEFEKLFQLRKDYYEENK